MSIYADLGIPTIINAKGPSTRVSGGFLAPEVAGAMADAGRYCVDVAELQAHASKLIAEVTGAEAGIVTSGAAAGLLLGTAACVAGLDPGRMGRLPDTSGMKNEVVMVRSQRNFYDHAVRTVGVKLVEVGLPDRYAGAGVRDAEAWELADAVTDRTAAIFWVAGGNSQPPLPAVAQVARAAGVPLIVDAAAQLPPASNLKRFIGEGADLVAFSGGKAIGGPQGSGILCGKRDLVMSAILQNLDLDIYWEQWSPPASLIDKARLRGLPQHGIGRTCKVGKETVIGLMVALKRFVAESDEARRGRWMTLIEALAKELGEIPKAKAIMADGMIPKLQLTFDAGGRRAMEVCLALQNGNPSVHCDNSRVNSGVLSFSPVCLREEDLPKIAARMKTI